MTISHTHKPSESFSERLDPLAGWLTLAVVLIILAGTLFPYRLSLEATASRRVGFFLFWFVPMEKHWRGWILNLLMFLPFGFVLAWWTRVRGWRWLSGTMGIGAAGFLFSYTVEFAQLFLVRRNSSWDDVLLNTSGALVGRLLFTRWGARLLRSAEGLFAGFTASFER